MTWLAIVLLWAQSPDPEALSARALEMAQQRRFSEAEQLWKQALQISPKLYSAAFNLGYMYHSQRQPAKAEPYLIQAVAANPKEFSARYLLGMVFSQTGRIDEALKQWRAALALRPNDVKLMQVMAVEYGKARYFREAAAVAERGLTLKTDDPSLYLIAIKAHQDSNDHEAALKVAGQMVRSFPELGRANFEYAYELNRTGRPEEAAPFLKKAMEADPTYEEPFFLHGEILSRASRWDESIAAYRHAIQLRRDYIIAWIALGRALMSAGRYDEAEVELLRAVEISPKHPQPHLLLSQLYYRLGKEELAAKEKQVSLSLRRENRETMEAPQGRPFVE